MNWSTAFCRCHKGFTKNPDNYLCAVCGLLPPAPVKLVKGDKITIAGHYEPRTFWQWLTGASRQLKKFKVKDDLP